MNGISKHRFIYAKDYFADIPIPDDWGSIEEFVDWYLLQRMPLMIPWDSQIINTDDATSMPIFKKGRYQVELYLIKPYEVVPYHSHPEIEIITLYLGGGGNSEIGPMSIHNTGNKWGVIANRLPPGQYHGGNTERGKNKGFCLIAFQKWPADIEITSAAIQWKGETAGPLHEELIRRHYPNSYVIPGFADITRNKE